MGTVVGLRVLAMKRKVSIPLKIASSVFVHRSLLDKQCSFLLAFLSAAATNGAVSAAAVSLFPGTSASCYTATTVTHRRGCG